MAKGLPKNIIAKYGISKKAWDIYRGLKRKVNKPRRHSKSTVKNMAKRKRRFRRARPYHRRRRDHRLSILGTASVVGSIFTGGSNNPNRRSLGMDLMEYANGQRKATADNITWTLADTVEQYVGYNYKANRWSIPFGTVVLIAGAVASKVAGKYGNRYLSGIPLIGKHIKF